MNRPAPISAPIRLALAITACCALLGAQDDDGETKSLISLIRDDRRGQLLQQARAALRDGKNTRAVELLLECLEAPRSAVVGRGKGIYLGLRDAARKELSKLDDAAAAIYERLAGKEVGVRVAEAATRNDAIELSSIAIRSPFTNSARAARLLAGDRFFEQGRIVRALQEFMLIGPDDAGDVTARRAVCRALLGMRPVAGPLDATTRLPFGEDRLDPTTFRARIGSLEPVLFREDYWPAYGGGLGARVAQTPPHVNVEHGRYSTEELEDLDDYSRDLTHNSHPVTDGERVFVNTGTRLYALPLRSGKTRGWESPSWMADLDGYELESHLSTTSPNMPHSAAVGGGIVVAPLQVPYEPEDLDTHSWWGRRRSWRLPTRRLHAFDAKTGKPVWSHYSGNAQRPDPEQLTGKSLNVAGPPLIVDDTVFVTTHRLMGGIAAHVSAFDLSSGTRKWTTLVCTSQIEANRHGNAYIEFAASPLTYSDGVLFGATHLGLSFAVRADDGSVSWLHEYSIIPIPIARRRSRRPELRTFYWANSPPVVAKGVVVMTPIDSLEAIAIDRSTGRRLWSIPYSLFEPSSDQSYEFRWLLGATGGYAWFSGQGICRVKLRGKGAGVPELIADPQDPDAPDDTRRIPRGLLTKDRIVHVSPRAGLVVLDHSGRRVANAYQDPTLSFGNLLSSNGVLVSVRAGEIRALIKR